MTLLPYEVIARNIEPAADNKIHDDNVAQSFGFTGALVPGVELFAYLTAPLVAAWGLPWFTGGRVGVRFRRPVYDGETVTVKGTPADLQIDGPDDQNRAVGSAEPPGALAPPPALAVMSLPTQLRSLDAVSVGPLGTVQIPGTIAENEAYLDAVHEPSPVYRREEIAHPGALLRLVNLVLMRNVDLGPWIHTASDCRLLAPARLPAAMSVRAEVRETFTRNGSDYVAYEAVVLADDAPVMAVAHTAIYRLPATSAG